MDISELRPEMGVDTLFKVVSKGETRETRKGRRLAEALVGDATGTVILNLWEENIDKVKVGKTYRLRSGYVGLFQGYMRLTVGREGTLEKAEEAIGDVNMEKNLSDKVHSFRQRRRGRFGRW